VMNRLPLIVNSHSVPLFQLALPSKQNSGMNSLLVLLFLSFSRHIPSVHQVIYFLKMNRKAKTFLLILSIPGICS
jgi:hypothetical protein